ncbi:hypothetical protein [Lacticaseibacillus parakribbianus]|uniref:hypothetical protein n=1 Tax=Lacticaseibacillus parakribbianus TaxID=2970927 RepID=UPI0021CB82C7|nr:hypothetical protein [Lacticaseibacillus parakribbianus]
MLGLFLGITLRFTAAGVAVGLIGAIALAVRHRAGRAWRLAVTTVLLFALMLALIYFALPEPSLATTVLWNLLTGTVAALITASFAGGGAKIDWTKFATAAGKHGKAPRQDVTPGAKSHKPTGLAKPFLRLAGAGFVLSLIAMAVFAIMGVVDAKQVANNAPVISYQSTTKAPLPVVGGKKAQAPVVNAPATVLTQVNNSLSNIPNANVYAVDHVRAQINGGKLVYVAPLDFDGSFFRYLRYKQVDGYFKVDATSKSASPRFVKKAMRYTPAAYFGQDARRLMYAATATSGYVMMSNTPQLEIAEDGTPYYVATLVRRYGVTNRQDFRHKAVVTLNAESGQLHFYRNLAQKPDWLDVAIDPTTASSQVAAWGAERNGWWNANGWGGARNGVMVAVTGAGTEGHDNDVTPVMYDGQIYYQQSLTSAKSAQTSVMGYTFTDAATGKTYYYRETHDAMTPDRAQKLAKDMMKQTGWKPKMPMLYRIDGRPTWVVSMLDSSDAFRSYVYLLASGNGTQSTVATGSDADAALTAYRALFGSDPTAAATAGKKTKVQGTVNRVSLSGDAMSFLLDDDPVVYTVSVKTDPRARFIMAGDKLTFTARVAKGLGSVAGKVTNGTLK